MSVVTQLIALTHATRRQRDESSRPWGNNKKLNMSKPSAGCQRCIAKEAIKSPAGSEPGFLSNAYVAYWLPVNLMAAAPPKARKSQPTGLYGLREATIAPTVAKGTAVERTRGMRAPSLTGHSRNPSPIVATTRVHRSQVVAARKSIPLATLPCSLVPSIKHNTTALSSPKRYDDRYEEEDPRRPSSENTARVKFAGLTKRVEKRPRYAPSVWSKPTRPERIEFLMRMVVSKKDYL